MSSPARQRYLDNIHHQQNQRAVLKPHGILLQAAEDYGINLAETFFIGDMPRDREAALRAGIRFILVEHEHKRTLPEFTDVDLRVNNLLEAAEIVIQMGNDVKKDIPSELHIL